MEIRWENWTLRLLTSLKVIGTDSGRSITDDFLFTFHSNRNPLLTVPRYSEISAENCRSLNSRLINGSCERDAHWNRVTALGLIKTRTVELRGVYPL